LSRVSGVLKLTGLELAVDKVIEEAHDELVETQRANKGQGSPFIIHFSQERNP
jgi:hypothetical protein